MKDKNKDREYIIEAYRMAQYNSIDPSTQNGAIIVSKDGEIIGRAVNGFPRGVEEFKDRLERPLKYKFIEHAERNAIYMAVLCGKSTNHATMYCPFFACADCSRAIIQAGITKVVGHIPNGLDKYGFMPSSEIPKDGINWREDCEIGFQMLKEANVEFHWLTEPINQEGLFVRRGGKIIQP